MINKIIKYNNKIINIIFFMIFISFIETAKHEEKHKTKDNVEFKKISLKIFY